MKTVMGLVLLATIVSTAVSAQPANRSRQHWCGHGMLRDSIGTLSSMITPRQIIPIDGGFVIMQGDELIKFDNNLNRKKVVVLGTDLNGRKPFRER